MGKKSSAPGRDDTYQIGNSQPGQDRYLTTVWPAPGSVGKMCLVALVSRGSNFSMESCCFSADNG